MFQTSSPSLLRSHNNINYVGSYSTRRQISSGVIIFALWVVKEIIIFLHRPSIYLSTYSLLICPHPLTFSYQRPIHIKQSAIKTVLNRGIHVLVQGGAGHTAMTSIGTSINICLVGEWGFGEGGARPGGKTLKISVLTTI